MPRHPNPLAPGQIPSGLTSPTGYVVEPGRTIWKFPAPPVRLHFGGGAIITSSRLVPLFWGDFWRAASNPSVGDIHQAIAQILASPYLSEVIQYGFESLSLDPARIVVSPGPSSPTFSGVAVKDMIWDLIDDGQFPEPDDGGRNVYMVIAPQGTRHDNPDDAGAHGDAEDYDFPFDTDHAWVGWCNYGTLDDITEILTHELVEILTDPEPYDGWTVDGMPQANNEIVDICFNQTGMVSGYRVAAYYSDRLKACVVPSFPQQYGLAVSTSEQRIGPARVQLIGRTATTKNSFCFSGTYDWTLIGERRRVTLTATAIGYVEAEFAWKVNGVSVADSGSLPGVLVQTVTTAGATTLDPLSTITTEAPHTVTARMAAAANVMAIESQIGEPAGAFDVTCTVTEKRLPSGYHTARTDQRAIVVAGSFRSMDERFQSDLAHCMHLKSVLARELIEEVVIPRIDHGDPPEVWVEAVLREAETPSDSWRQARDARQLAHFVGRVDPALAATLRYLADGVIAVGRVAGVTADDDVDRIT
jgi:hypothetical protein